MVYPLPVVVRRLLLASCLLILPACTAKQLQRNTSDMAKTLPDVMQDQVLANYVKLHCNHYAIPAFVAISGGSSQLTDLLGASVASTFQDNLTKMAVDNHTPTFSGSRQAAYTWTLTAVTNPDALERLQVMYFLVSGGTIENWKFRKTKGPDGKALSAEDSFKFLFTADSPPKDKEGKPFLKYTPIIEDKKGNPVANDSIPGVKVKWEITPLKARPIIDSPQDISDLSGFAEIRDCKCPVAKDEQDGGVFDGHRVVITNPEHFQKFMLDVLAVLNSGNSTSSGGSSGGQVQLFTIPLGPTFVPSANSP